MSEVIDIQEWKNAAAEAKVIKKAIRLHTVTTIPYTYKRIRWGKIVDLTPNEMSHVVENFHAGKIIVGKQGTAGFVFSAKGRILWRLRGQDLWLRYSEPKKIRPNSHFLLTNRKYTI